MIPLAPIALTGARQTFSLGLHPDVFDRVVIGNQSNMIIDIDNGGTKLRLQPLAIDVLRLGSTFITIIPTSTNFPVVLAPQLELQAVRADEPLDSAYPQTLPTPQGAPAQAFQMGANFPLGRTTIIAAVAGKTIYVYQIRFDSNGAAGFIIFEDTAQNAIWSGTDVAAGRQWETDMHGIPLQPGTGMAVNMGVADTLRGAIVYLQQ